MGWHGENQRHGANTAGEDPGKITETHGIEWVERKDPETSGGLMEQAPAMHPGKGKYPAAMTFHGDWLQLGCS